jgi:hypothetical protein
MVVEQPPTCAVAIEQQIEQELKCSVSYAPFHADGHDHCSRSRQFADMQHNIVQVVPA